MPEEGLEPPDARIMMTARRGHLRPVRRRSGVLRCSQIRLEVGSWTHSWAHGSSSMVPTGERAGLQRRLSLLPRRRPETTEANCPSLLHLRPTGRLRAVQAPLSR